MYFESFSSLLHMGGYGAYVWPSYLLALLVVVCNVVAPIRARQQLRKTYLRTVRREEGTQ